MVDQLGRACKELKVVHLSNSNLCNAFVVELRVIFHSLSFRRHSIIQKPVLNFEIIAKEVGERIGYDVADP